MTTEPAEPALRDQDFPGLFQAADRTSLRGQRAYLHATRIRLGLVIAAAGLGLLVGFSPLFAVGTAFCFCAALLVEVYILTQRPETAWYDGRALAESAKTLTWRFAVGADPFPVRGGEGADDAPEQLRSRLRHLLRDAQQTGIEATPAASISEHAVMLRASDLSTRKDVYLRQRIIDQQTWYSRKAEFNRRRALRWRLGLLGAEAVGILAALAFAAQVVRFDVGGLIAAAVGAGAAWLSTRQHESTARAYALASHELSLIRDRLGRLEPGDEQRWAAEVADAEEAISREHTMWRASRTSADPQGI